MEVSIRRSMFGSVWDKRAQEASAAFGMGEFEIVWVVRKEEENWGFVQREREKVKRKGKIMFF